jgi:hypothetical protein
LISRSPGTMAGCLLSSDTVSTAIWHDNIEEKNVRISKRVWLHSQHCAVTSQTQHPARPSCWRTYNSAHLSTGLRSGSNSV